MRGMDEEDQRALYLYLHGRARARSANADRIARAVHGEDSDGGASPAELRSKLDHLIALGDASRDDLRRLHLATQIAGHAQAQRDRDHADLLMVWLGEHGEFES